MQTTVLATRRRRIVAIVLLTAVVGVAASQWRSLYVAWTIRSARQQLAMGDTEQARSALASLRVARDLGGGGRPELLFLLGRASRRAGDVQEAMEYLRRAAEAGWSRREVQQQSQLALIQRGKLDDLTSVLSVVSSNGASDEFAYEAYEAMAKGYLFSYRFADAMQCLGFWIEWCPGAIEPRMMRAAIWEQSQNWERAIVEYREILAIDEDQLDARLAMAGHMLLQLNQANEAIVEFEHGRKLEPENPKVILGIAACLRQLGHTEAAETHLKILLKRDLDPEHRKNAQLELGQILLDSRKLDEAVPLLEAAAAADPRDAATQYSLGSVYAACGRHDEAQACLRKSRTLQQQFSRMTDVTRELVSHPERADLRCEAGQIMMDQGLWDEGAAWMSTVLIYDPRHQKAHAALARYYETAKLDPAMAEHHRSQLHPVTDPAVSILSDSMN